MLNDSSDLVDPHSFAVSRSLSSCRMNMNIRRRSSRASMTDMTVHVRKVIYEENRDWRDRLLFCTLGNRVDVQLSKLWCVNYGLRPINSQQLLVSSELLITIIFDRIPHSKISAHQLLKSHSRMCSQGQFFPIIMTSYRRGNVIFIKIPCWQNHRTIRTAWSLLIVSFLKRLVQQCFCSNLYPFAYGSQQPSLISY